MWTVNDKRFLRSMRIQSTDPPVPLPRFRVEPAATKGWYRVIDSVFRPVVEIEKFGPKSIPNARAAADDKAAELNAKHVKSGGAQS